jgi:hypothetical protein
MAKKKTKAAAVPAEAGAAAEWVDPGTLNPWDRNPRKNEGAVAKVAESIKRFGFGAPLVARRSTRELIAGHTRLKAALKLGLDRVPVRFLDLDEQQAHLLALADNRLGEIAEWDMPSVESLSKDFTLKDIDFTGFSLKNFDLGDPGDEKKKDESEPTNDGLRW